MTSLIFTQCDYTATLGELTAAQSILMTTLTWSYLLGELTSAQSLLMTPTKALLTLL